jgi:Undecaprenyl-phosphate glucose phosphotransferase
MRVQPLSITPVAQPLRLAKTKRNWPVSYRSVGGVVLTADVFIVLFCGIASGILYHFIVFDATGDITDFFGCAVLVAAFYISVMKGQGLYGPAELLDLKPQIVSVTTTWLGVFLFLSGAAFALKIGDHFSRGAIFSFASVGLGCLVAQRVFARYLIQRGLNNQKFAGRNAVLVTDQTSGLGSDFVAKLVRQGFRLVHQFVLPDKADPQRRDEVVSDVITYLRGSDVDEVIVGVDMGSWSDFKKLLSDLRMLPLPVNVIPLGDGSDIFRRPAHVIGDAVCVEIQREPLGSFERGVKRTLDLIGAMGALIVLLPLLAVTALLIKLDSPGPILFRQKRCGFNGRHYYVWKFRTMSVLEDGPSVNQAEQSDYRVTRVGKLLRRASIDELPQLLNVLEGTMSLVGPRPHAVAHDNRFNQVMRNYAFRHHVKPGLTGWAQVHGHRGPTPTIAHIRRRVECDLWYIDNWSLRLDFEIIGRTIFEVMRGRNAY